MNNECNVARDLMPLVIDKVASEESSALVEAHVADCSDCAQVYTDMQVKVPENKDIAEEVSFAAAMRQLRRTVGWRRIKVIILCAVIAPAMLVAGYLAYVHLFLDISRPMPLDWYSVNLSRTKDGIVLASIDNTEGWSNYSYSEGGMGPNYSGIIYLSFDCPIFPTRKFSENPRYTSYVDLRWKDGKCLYPDIEDESVMHPVREIRKGTESNYEVLYKEGDEIPFCPRALDDYIQVEKASDGYFGGFLWFPASLVPEWK